MAAVGFQCSVSASSTSQWLIFLCFTPSLPPSLPHSCLSFASHLISPPVPLSSAPLPFHLDLLPHFFSLFVFASLLELPFFFFSPGHPAGLALVLDSSRRLLTWGPWVYTHANSLPHTHLQMLRKVGAEQGNSEPLKALIEFEPGSECAGEKVLITAGFNAN